MAIFRYTKDETLLLAEAMVKTMRAHPKLKVHEAWRTVAPHPPKGVRPRPEPAPWSSYQGIVREYARLIEEPETINGHAEGVTFGVPADPSVTEPPPAPPPADPVETPPPPAEPPVPEMTHTPITTDWLRQHGIAVLDENPRPVLGDMLVEAGASIIERMLVTAAKRLFHNPELRAILASAVTPPPAPLVAGSVATGLELQRAGVKATTATATLAREGGRRPRILVCGMRPNLHRVLENAAANKAILQFWWDQGVPQLKSKAAEVDDVIVADGMENISTHALSAIEQSGKKPLRGYGLDGAKHVLEKLLVKYEGKYLL